MTSEYVVHIVDDDPAVRRSAGFMLRLAGYAVATYEAGTAFLRQASKAKPGCVLLDVRMPDLDGLEVQQALIAQGITMPVIVLTGHGDVATAVQAMRAGAVNFLEKPYTKEALLHVIQEALAHLDKAHAGEIEAAEAKTLLNALTPREHDVLNGLVAGLPNKTIAYDLGISARTVEIHRANLMEKLNARSLSEVLRIAFAAGLGRSIGTVETS